MSFLQRTTSRDAPPRYIFIYKYINTDGEGQIYGCDRLLPGARLAIKILRCESYNVRDALKHRLRAKEFAVLA